jgi:tetratricopeptide (TPR) repeat protein
MSSLRSPSLLFLILAFLGSSCKGELIRQQAEQIERQQQEIARQTQEIEALKSARQKEEQKRRDCNRAFRDYFEKAQASQVSEEAVSLYRDGLELCPDDDVAHYELGKMMLRLGQAGEAQEEFEKALALNPDLERAKRELKSMKSR